MKLKARMVEHWGKKHRISPMLIDRIWGDGKQVIWLTPLNTRPVGWLGIKRMIRRP